MNLKSLLHKSVPHIIAIASFIIVSSIYFYPAWQGKTLQGEDVVGSAGQAREKWDLEHFEGITPIWNGSIFCGMPDYVGARYEGATNLGGVFFIPRELGLPAETEGIFWYMLGLYILLITLGVKPVLSAGGAMVFALTSYNIIIIMAGHYMKVHTLALIPPTLAGVLLCFNRKYLWGFILTAFFLAMQINIAHIQMTYYFMLALIILGGIEFYFHIKEKQIKRFFITSAVLIGAAILAIAPNYAKLINYYTYNDYSMRGGSELTLGNEDDNTAGGLDRDYLNMWSSGVDESLMIIAPNVKGGSTSVIKQNRELLNKIPRQYRETLGNFNQYWGDQIFSGGPSYLGAIFLFLFILGAFLIKGRFKIAVIIPVILFFFLSMGGNLSFFTDLFIDYVPMYNKFRAPVSILAVAAIYVSLLAVFTLHKIGTTPDLLQKKSNWPLKKKPQPLYLLVSIGLLAFLLLIILLPETFNTFISQQEQNQINGWMQQANLRGQVEPLIQSLVDFRMGVFRADLWRAFIFVAIGTLLLYLYAKQKLKKNVLFAIFMVVALIDVWGISRRYVPLENFTKRNLTKEAHQLTDADRQIYQLEMNGNPKIRTFLDSLIHEENPKNKEEEDRLLTYAVNKYSYYRVLNTTGRPFQENVTANGHRSIGGYSAFKLRRYNDLIEHHISKMNRGVLNMLNTKYFITPNGLQVNPDAMGAGWFVDSVKWVNSANDEILALNSINVSSTAVINEKYREKVQDFEPKTEGDTISLVDYNPDHLTYKTTTQGNRLAVFSEVYYPDWKVFIDGQEADLFSTNYVLRGVVIPAGNHMVEFVFHPAIYYTSNKISLIAFYILIAGLVIAVGWSIRNGLKKTPESVVA